MRPIVMITGLFVALLLWLILVYAPYRFFGPALFVGLLFYNLLYIYYWRKDRRDKSGLK